MRKRNTAEANDRKNNAKILVLPADEGTTVGETLWTHGVRPKVH